MNTESSQTRAAGLLFLRALLGIILFMQGYGKVFSMGIQKVYAMYFEPYESTFLPNWMVMTTAYYTSYVELIGGTLLLLGWFRKYTLYFIALDLWIVSFGHGMVLPIWDLQHVMPRAILVVTILLLPQDWDRWSLDFYVLRNKQL